MACVEQPEAGTPYRMKLYTLGFIMVVLACAVTFILGLAIGMGSQGELTFTADSLSSWIGALATVCIAVLTIVLARETWSLRSLQQSQIEQIRKASIQPNINVMLKSSSSNLNMINVYISNNGNGLAKNVRFHFENENPEAENVYNYVKQKVEKLSMLNNGLVSLGAGQTLMSFLYSAHEIAGKFTNKFDYQAGIEITCEDNEGTAYSFYSNFTFSEFEGRSELDSPLNKIAKSLDLIAKNHK